MGKSPLVLLPWHSTRLSQLQNGRRPGKICGESTTRRQRLGRRRLPARQRQARTVHYIGRRPPLPARGLHIFPRSALGGRPRRLARTAKNPGEARQGRVRREKRATRRTVSPQVQPALGGRVGAAPFRSHAYTLPWGNLPAMYCIRPYNSYPRKRCKPDHSIQIKVTDGLATQKMGRVNKALIGANARTEGIVAEAGARSRLSRGAHAKMNALSVSQQWSSVFAEESVASAPQFERRVVAGQRGSRKAACVRVCARRRSS